MTSSPTTEPLSRRFLAWLTVVLAGVIGPSLALLMLSDSSAHAPIANAGGTIITLGLMGTGMIAAAAARRFWIGVFLSLLTGTGLTVVALGFGTPIVTQSLLIGLTFFIASSSFAARGALFARSAAENGWLIAVLVVAGEAAILLTAWAEPGLWPNWLLALLPAQWANIAIQSVLKDAGSYATNYALIALGGTAVATLFVARLWPRRWPYLIMFTAWLGLSALVYHQPGLPMQSAEQLQG